MEYIYAALLLHSAGKKPDESGLKAVIKAAGLEPDEARIKAVISALKDINIDEVIKQPLAIAAAPSQAAPEKKEEKKEEKEEKKAEEAAAGLSALFG
ncbi:MAG: 50S ribosomal protein P1 [Candidatus Aenigmatarchaeota archaeon]